MFFEGVPFSDHPKFSTIIIKYADFHKKLLMYLKDFYSRLVDMILFPNRVPRTVPDAKVIMSD